MEDKNPLLFQTDSESGEGLSIESLEKALENFRVPVIPIKYEPSAEEMQRLDNNFTYHKPIGDQQRRYEVLRSVAKDLATLFLRLCPPSRERSVALTELETALMWANASISRNEKE